MTAGRTPRASIIVPAYNAEPWIEASVRSLLAQTVENLEIVVVDDGSTDATVRVVESIRDPRVTIVRAPHAGKSTARNIGLDVAAGSSIGFQDADDVSLPQRVELQLDALESGAGFSHTDMMLVDPQEQPIHYLAMGQTARAHVLPFLLRIGTPFGNGSILARREVFDGVRFNPGLPVGEDTDAVRQFAARFENVHVAAPLYLYRRHESNATNDVGPDTLWPHIEMLVRSEPLESLVPEAFRAYGQTDCAAALARAVIGAAVIRRGFLEQGKHWLDLAGRGLTDPDCISLISAMIDLLTGACETAAEKAAGVRRTAVSVCLQAQAAGQSGDPVSAARLYLEAMTIDPSNFDALMGYRSAGAARGVAFADTTLRRFAP